MKGNDTHPIACKAYFRRNRRWVKIFSGASALSKQRFQNRLHRPITFAFSPDKWKADGKVENQVAFRRLTGSDLSPITGISKLRQLVSKRPGSIPL